MLRAASHAKEMLSARRPIVGSPWQAQNRAGCGVGPGQATLAPRQGPDRGLYTAKCGSMTLTTSTART